MPTQSSPFSDEFLKAAREKLLEEKTRVEADLGKISKKSGTAGERTAEFPEYGDDEDENVQEIEEYTVNKPLEMSLESTLRDINKSLKRLDEGSYGICKYCDNPIDEKRLSARPTSSACVSCKKLLTDEA